MVGSDLLRPSGAPGRPTFVRPVRIGDCPVTKAARPAVQLCSAYQSVNSAPSLAMRSMLGVREPMPPLLEALTLNHPMSSAMIIKIFGLRADGAGAGARWASVGCAI